MYEMVSALAGVCKMAVRSIKIKVAKNSHSDAVGYGGTRVSGVDYYCVLIMCD